MIPYEPLDDQLIALQFRLMRAARAMLDPMLNLGMIDRARAENVLIDDVGLSNRLLKYLRPGGISVRTSGTCPDVLAANQSLTRLFRRRSHPWLR